MAIPKPFSYSGTKLQSVIDSYNRSLTFTYSGNALLEVTTPEGNNLIYTVSGAGYALSQVQFPTSPGTSVTYNYSDTFPDALTSVVDENDNTYETWTYDSQERALTSQLGSGANLTTLVYNSNGTTTVTNALGVADTYTFTTLQGIPKVTGISRAATGTTAAASETITYDANGYQASITDWNGNQTTYVNNSHGLPTTINEAVGSSVARATTITYDSTWTRLPATIVTPGVTVGRTYDSQGEELTTKLSDTTSNTIPYSTNGQTRTTTRTWLNQLLSSIETPNGNTTHFGYSSSGALTSVTDPLSHVTNITSYTGGGLPKTIVDPNGVTTTLTYSPRQWLMSTAVSGSGGTFTTTYTFDAAGNLTQTKLPDNSYLTLTFDTAHRITRITDTLGNYINYTLDALGDRTTVDYDDSTGAVYKNYSDSFDALGRELVHTGGRGQTVTTAYDANGNATSIKDGNGHATVNAYDALNRLHTTTDPNSGVTTLTLDAHDRTTNVQDANTHSTAYIYNGFGDRTQQVSPDSGTTVYYFDGDANLTKKTDALGVTVNMTYDTLDRILTKTFPADSTQNVGYTYDDTGYGPFTFGIGRLSAITDASGSRYLGYDERGNIITNQHVNGSSNYNIYHTYDAAGRLSGISYPSGIFVGYSHDTVGNINEVFVDPSGSSTAQVVAYMGYDPFGPMDYITYGSGITGPFSHDRDYNITNITETGTSGTIENLTYTLDNNNNVSTITNSLNSADNQTNGYDIINRLTSAVSGTGGYGSYSWTYDKVGNRLTQTAGSTTTTYGYTSGTNRLASLSGGMTATITTNANGNITNIPTANTGASATYTYNVANRASSVTGSPIGATFVYDDFGQRFKKTESGSAPSYYTYGEDGALLEESNGTTVTDYIYANGRPIGMFLPVSGGTSGNMYYVHTDQLGTPQFVTNGSQAKVWSTTYQPFGTTGTITSSLTTQNLRLPGQQFDVETGFYYNHFRDLMPPFGRYLEADPSGLEGGANAYLYANAAPSKYVDLKGLVTANLTLPWDLTYPANEAYNPPGVFSYAGHGNEYDPNSLYATHSAETGVSPQFVGDYIMNHGWDQKQTIVAVQCFGTKGGDNSFVAQLAQYLANKTNKTVNIVGSPDEVLPERWHIIGTSIYTGGADPGPDGWQLITRTPQ